MFSRSDTNIPDGPFTSARLTYQKLCAADEDAMWEMFSSDAVMQYVPYEPETDRVAWTKTFFEQMTEGKRYKFFYGFKWRDESQEEKGILGLVILRPTEDGTQLEAGYWVKEQFWGKGLASEACSRMVELAENELGIDPKYLMATVMHGNDASRKVLENAGFKVIGDLMEDVGPCWNFRRDV